MCYDIIFKSVFQNQENILGKMISDITGIDYSLLKDNIILETNELPISRKNEKAKKCDFILKIEPDYVINLELNRQSHIGLIVKNLSYLFNLFSSSTRKGEKYNSNLIVMQINLNCFQDKYYENAKPLSRYHIREEDTHQIYSNNVVIYSLNVVKCHELYYNEDKLEIPNYVRWGALIYCDDFSKIPEITKGILTYEERNLIMGIVSKLTKEDLFMTEEEALEWADWERRTICDEARQEGLKEGRIEGLAQGIEEGIEKGIEQGIEKGIEKGIEQTKIETIKQLLKKKISLEDIREITGKSIEEIKNIKANMK